MDIFLCQQEFISRIKVDERGGLPFRKIKSWIESKRNRNAVQAISIFQIASCTHSGRPIPSRFHEQACCFRQ